MRDKILNKTFWHFLMGFLAALAISLFVIILASTVSDVSSDDSQQAEECILFC